MRKPAWQSRKLWVSMIGAVGVLVNEVWGVSLPVEALATIAVVIITYVASESYIDSKK